MSKYFKFKKFQLAQDQCAMKVGTDGVLLGAWTMLPPAVDYALDIGTGTGVIALMLAQRNKELQLTAIDIAPEAILQATMNFEQSIFSNRLETLHCSLQDFVILAKRKYSLIISNPPFFSSGKPAKNNERAIARHTLMLPLEDLFDGVSHLLTEEGLFSLIIPIQQREDTLRIAAERGLYCHRECIVFPNPIKQPKRVLLTFGFRRLNCLREELTIETERRHHYTSAYMELLRDFYLAF